MTQQHESHRPQRYEGGLEAEPRDGPAVLVVNRRLLDEGVGLSGGWLRLDQATPALVEQLGQILGTNGRPEDYVVVDQIGLGPTMWGEGDVTGLLALAGVPDEREEPGRG